MKPVKKIVLPKRKIDGAVSASLFLLAGEKVSIPTPLRCRGHDN